MSLIQHTQALKVKMYVALTTYNENHHLCPTELNLVKEICRYHIILKNNMYLCGHKTDIDRFRYAVRKGSSEGPWHESHGTGR